MDYRCCSLVQCLIKLETCPSGVSLSVGGWFGLLQGRLRTLYKLSCFGTSLVHSLTTLSHKDNEPRVRCPKKSLLLKM